MSGLTYFNLEAAITDFSLLNTDEERQDSHHKRRRIEDHRRQGGGAPAQAQNPREPSDKPVPGSMQLNGQEYVTVTPQQTSRGGQLHPGLPSRPNFDIVPKANVDDKSSEGNSDLKQGIAALGGSNSDVVKNRRAIRMANMSAAQALKAELEGGASIADVGADEEADKEIPTTTVENTEDEEKEQLAPADAANVLEQQAQDDGVDQDVVPAAIQTDEDEGEAGAAITAADENMVDENEVAGDGTATPRSAKESKKRKRNVGDSNGDEENAEDNADGSSSDSDSDDNEAPPNPEADQPVPKKKLKVNPDGTVEGYEDDVKLWEPGYRERYYEKKFGASLSDGELISK